MPRLDHWALAALLALSPMSTAAAVTVGQADDFEDGTTQGWTAGGGPFGAIPPVPPANVGGGGPQGADDNYLLITAIGGNAAGSRLTAMNGAQWSGDYLAAGVRGISMWVLNLGTVDLSLRLFLEDPAGGPPTNTAFSTDPVTALAGGGWQQVFFSLDADDLTAGVGDVATALSNVTLLRLYHGVAPGFPGEAIVGQLGVDDIRALAVPEPAAWALMIAGFGLAGAALRRGYGMTPSRRT